MGARSGAACSPVKGFLSVCRQLGHPPRSPARGAHPQPPKYLNTPGAAAPQPHRSGGDEQPGVPGTESLPPGAGHGGATRGRRKVGQRRCTTRQKKVTGTAPQQPDGGLPVPCPPSFSPGADSGAGGIQQPRCSRWHQTSRSKVTFTPRTVGGTPGDLTPRKRPRARERNLAAEHRRASGCRRDAGWDGAVGSASGVAVPGGCRYLSARLQKSRMAGMAVPGSGRSPELCWRGARHVGARQCHSCRLAGAGKQPAMS